MIFRRILEFSEKTSFSSFLFAKKWKNMLEFYKRTSPVLFFEVVIAGCLCITLCISYCKIPL